MMDMMDIIMSMTCQLLFFDIFALHFNSQGQPAWRVACGSGWSLGCEARNSVFVLCWKTQNGHNGTFRCVPIFFVPIFFLKKKHIKYGKVAPKEIGPRSFSFQSLNSVQPLSLAQAITTRYPYLIDFQLIICIQLLYSDLFQKKLCTISIDVF